MIYFFEFAAGLLTTVLLGFGAKPLLTRAKKSMELPPPRASLASQWKAIAQSNEGGAILGWLERLIFFAAFIGDGYILVGAWLAFKVASKWQAWSNIINVPSSIDGIDPIDFLIARRSWGSHLLMTFLIGTAYNILAALVGAGISRHGNELFSFLVEATCGTAL